MAPAKARRVKTGAKVPPESQEMEAPPDLGRPEDNPRLYNPAHHPFAGLFDEDTRNTFYNRLERCQGRINMLIHKKKLSFKKSVMASFKAMQQIIEKSLKTGREQRQAFYLNYYQKSLVVFQKWEHHLQKLKKCEKTIATLSQMQKQLGQYVEMLRTEKMKQLRTLYEAFLKSMSSLKEEQRKLAEEQGGFTKEMAMLQQESMKQAHQDLASILKRFQPRLGVVLKKKPNCGGIAELHDQHTESTRL
ncbi:synaptonemal complex protein 3-like [Ochotona princeps]|uniref:synaptonemal complex protein 3-like n=1 Tax=Ochotona princeps TaxID=9978 RepID=UPI00271497B2|nr:synaptonemal complex protein 3-like [Ochotona princeps]XP_058514825.1 synaptonemal complex protein 3-like [Ochotona princeps]